MHHDELYDTISMREEEIAELEAAVLREKRRVDSLHMKINELEAENKRQAEWIERAKFWLEVCESMHPYAPDELLALLKEGVDTSDN